MTKEELKQLFMNNFDCYADTREDSEDTIGAYGQRGVVDGPIVYAMTLDCFIEVLTPIFIDHKKTDIHE